MHPIETADAAVDIRLDKDVHLAITKFLENEAVGAEIRRTGWHSYAQLRHAGVFYHTTRYMCR